MGLKDKWNSLTREQKGLIGLAVVIIIVVLYAYNPISGTPSDNNTTQVQQATQPTTVTTVPFTQSGSNNTTVSNNTTGNGTNQITAEQAKNIATQSVQGYTAEEPTQGSINVDGASTSVWIVPLSKNNIVSKTLYIDANTGKIVQQT
jgi:uncharacterized membrane protein YkoI